MNTHKGIGTDSRVLGLAAWQYHGPEADLNNNIENNQSTDWNEMSFSFAPEILENIPDQITRGFYWETTFRFSALDTLPKNRKAEKVHMYGGAITSMDVEKVINIRDVAGSEFCISFRDGHRIFEAIRDAIYQEKHVAVSFENIRSLSAAFLESAIGQLYIGEIPKAKLKECITWKGISPERKLLIERAISEAKSPEQCLEGGGILLVMKNESIKNIEEHQFKADEQFVLDANILLYTFGPSDFRSGDRDHVYNDAMTKMIVNKCKLYMILPVLSEYIYRYLDKQLKLNKVDKDDLKAFRKTDAYKEIAEMIAADVREILNLVKCCNPTFENSKACEVLDRFLQCTLDFNDAIIENFCISNRLTLVTNDGDFRNSDVHILTANSSLYS